MSVLDKDLPGRWEPVMMFCLISSPGYERSHQECVLMSRKHSSAKDTVEKTRKQRSQGLAEIILRHRS